MAIIRTYAEVLELKPNEAERKLIEACKAGERCILGHDVPLQPSDTCTIRADILRYLLLGGCENCVVDGRGVWLMGGFISGTLDLDHAKVHGATQLPKCHFENRIESAQTRFNMVSLSGCTVSGWFAQETIVEGGVFLRDIRASATIDLNSATVGGQLDFRDAVLVAKESPSLSAQDARIEGDVVLHNCTATATINLHSAIIGGQLGCYGAKITTINEDAISASNTQIAGGVLLHPRIRKDRESVSTPFHANGELRFNGATVGGVYAQHVNLAANSTGQTLSLGGATVNGPVRLDGCASNGEILLAGSRISGRLTCERVTIRNDIGHAFNGQAMDVEHSFVWKKVDHISGAVSLNGAHVAELNDDPENWPDTDHLFLDGFTYDRIKGAVSVSPARMSWLKSGSFFENDFRPQPYSQYGHYLKKTGHDEYARQVLYTRERLRRANARRRLYASGETIVAARCALDFLGDTLLRCLVGYGHYPMRILTILPLLVLVAALPTRMAWLEGSFAPSSGPILLSQQWKTLAKSEQNPALVWSGDMLPMAVLQTAPDTTAAEWQAVAPGRDWGTFNHFAYAADLVIPLVDFGQTDQWSPSTTRGPWGKNLWWMEWVFTLLGWGVSTYVVARMTHIVGDD